GGVARYIQRQRLLEARAVLSDPRTTQSISAIAENLCFVDASSFSRAFKREFGYSPSQVRSAALAGVTLGAAPQPGVLSDRQIWARSSADSSNRPVPQPAISLLEQDLRLGSGHDLREGSLSAKPFACRLASVSQDLVIGCARPSKWHPAR